MKKLLFIMPLAVLAACGTPEHKRSVDWPQEVQVACGFWGIHAVIYNDHAVLDIKRNKVYTDITDYFDGEVRRIADAAPEWIAMTESRRVVATRDADSDSVDFVWSDGVFFGLHNSEKQGLWYLGISFDGGEAYPCYIVTTDGPREMLVPFEK
ncbi:MAG: hypothetical protein FWE64_03465 [Alphaproteobacteria bacterium]|nr:hypothetical protein [Alphaproteobacteria bacterium]